MQDQLGKRTSVIIKHYRSVKKAIKAQNELLRQQTTAHTSDDGRRCITEIIGMLRAWTSHKFCFEAHDVSFKITFRLISRSSNSVKLSSARKKLATDDPRRMQLSLSIIREINTRLKSHIKIQKTQGNKMVFLWITRLDFNVLFVTQGKRFGIVVKLYCRFYKFLNYFCES